MSVGGRLIEMNEFRGRGLVDKNRLRTTGVCTIDL